MTDHFRFPIIGLSCYCLFLGLFGISGGKQGKGIRNTDRWQLDLYLN